LDIYDIFGNVTTSGSYEILCVAGDISSNDEKRILRIDNNSVIQLSTNGILSTITGIWFKHGERYYVVGSGIYIKNDISSNNGWESISSGITEYFTNSIDGNDVNDIVVCGVYSELLHFNGFSWRSFKNEIQAGSYSEVKIRNNLVVAVGSDLSTAIITFGDRN
jgi:hypothetical protein